MPRPLLDFEAWITEIIPLIRSHYCIKVENVNSFHGFPTMYKIIFHAVVDGKPFSNELVIICNGVWKGNILNFTEKYMEELLVTEVDVQINLLSEALISVDEEPIMAAETLNNIISKNIVTSNMKFELMINQCYGGFSVSDEAVQSYLKSNGYVYSLYHIKRGVDRDDESMIEIVKELKEKANGKCAHIEIVSFPIKYKDYVQIGEYDGYETASINMDKYKLDTIRKILDHPETVSKMEKIYNVLEEECNEDDS